MRQMYFVKDYGKSNTHNKYVPVYPFSKFLSNQASMALEETIFYFFQDQAPTALEEANFISFKTKPSQSLKECFIQEIHLNDF